MSTGARWLRGTVVSLFLGAVTASAAPEVVTVGVYLRNVDAIDFQTNTYQLDFDLWMRWKAPLQPPPTESFRFVNTTDTWGLSVVPFFTDAEGHGAPKATADGGFYQRFHVEGTFYHKFWLGTYPLDWQKFTINVEDKLRDRGALIYAPDTKNSAVQEDLQVPGWALRDIENEERLIQSETNFGDPDRLEAPKISRYRFGVRLYRPARYFFLRLLPPLLIVFFTTALIFLLPTHHLDSRLAVVSTGILSEIFLQLTYSNGLPSISISTITDMIYNLAYGLLIAAFGICVLTARKHELLDRLAAEAAQREPAEQAAIQAQWQRAATRLRHANTLTAIGLAFLMLVGTTVIIVTMRGTGDLVW